MNQVVTLTSVEEKKRGTNKRGPWVLRVFTTAGGSKYQTFEVDLGEKAIGLLNQAAEINFEEEVNGDFTNFVLKSIKPASGGTDVEPSQAVDATLALSPAPKSDYETERQLRIMRQSALQRAIDTAATHGKIEDPQDLFKLADTYLLYFEAGSSAFTQQAEELKF